MQAIQSIARLPNRRVVIRGHTTPNRTIRIDLSHTPGGTNPPFVYPVADANGEFQYDYDSGANSPPSFYRLKLP